LCHVIQEKYGVWTFHFWKSYGSIV
jgi:hypothetical protein